MLYGFHNGPREATRLAKRFADANGMSGLNCVDAQPYVQPADDVRQKGLVRWTVRFDGLPRGELDDGSVVLLVDLDTSETRRLGRPKIA